jgi:signal transduction histidine kinase
VVISRQLQGGQNRPDMKGRRSRMLRYFFVLPSMILTLCSAYTSSQPISFRKINSGTKSDIRAIQKDKNQEVYFLTDKIYRRDHDTWKKLDFPIEGEIYNFYPVSARDIWFNVNQVTSTCLLYHYHDGITENIRPPLANSITSVFFISETSALFAGLADIALYEKGSFTMLPPSPARSSIIRIFCKEASFFWILSATGELFLYEKGIYHKVLDNKVVTDFCFNDMHDGYLLSGDELLRLDASGIRPIYKNADFRHVTIMNLMMNGTLMMAGKKGLIMSFTNGSLLHHTVGGSENLTDLVVTACGDTWISGENGRLLYSGKKQFPDYIEGNQGFSSHKLILYGISTDDEYGVAMADFNGDDKTDIYAVRIYEQNRLYINNLGSPDLSPFTSGFTEEAAQRNAIGVNNDKKSITQNELKLGIGAADIDNDNDQDIYLCCLNSVNKLLINNGNGYFRNVSAQKNRACGNLKRSNAAAFADIDIDGDLDLFVTSEEGSNQLFENDGTGHFTDITATSGLGSANGGMCASFADVDNDGYPDLCVTFWYPTNKLYINESKNGRIRFRDVTRLTDLAKAVPSKSNAVAFADVNNDGFLDLFIANRNTENKLYLNNGHGLFTDKTREYFLPDIRMSNGAVFADFDLDGFQDLYVTNVGQNVLYKNIRGRCFTDVTAAYGAEMSGYCTGCATGDVDNDGDPDLYVANYINGNSNLFLNVMEKKCFVKVKLHGVRSNKDAIGAKVWLYRDAGNNKSGVLAGYRELNGGNGYGSVSEKELIFGIEQGLVYYALIKFPSSPDTIRINRITAGQVLDIAELNGFRAFKTESRNRIVRFFTDGEKQPEIIKYMLILLLLVFINLKLRKTNRNIAIIHWITSGGIFILFILVNQLFLFQWFSPTFFIGPLVALGLLAIEHLFIDRFLLRRLARKEKLELREKLSRDLHDDLASTLGSISIYAETLKEMTQPLTSDFKGLPVKIASLTQAALNSVSEIIWMTSPRNDSLQSMISKASNNMLEILTDNNIRFHSAVDIPDHPVIMEEKTRNDIFLILKEGIYNCIRHSGARNVEFSAGIKENRCTISLKDDGIGIAGSPDNMKRPHGNGLLNMRRRALESGIELNIQSAEGSGTEIVMHFKI